MAERGLATRDYMQAVSTKMQPIQVQLVDTIIIFMAIDVFAVSTDQHTLGRLVAL